MYRILLLCLVFISSVVRAEEGPAAALESPDVPAMPLPVENGEPMEADITISRKGNKVIHEYSVNGKIYKIKVIPDVGPAYYFVDPDGDGEMEEVSQSDLDRDLNVNQWTLFSW